MRRGQLLPMEDPARAVLLARVNAERIRLRGELKKPFNQHFGSVFRFALHTHAHAHRDTQYATHNTPHPVLILSVPT